MSVAKGQSHDAPSEDGVDSRTPVPQEVIYKGATRPSTYLRAAFAAVLFCLPAASVFVSWP